jgi:hypothetical protein
LKASADRRFRLFTVLALALAAFALTTTSVLAGSGGGSTGKSSERELTEAAEGVFEALEAHDQYTEARTAPAETVDAGAFTHGYADFKALPQFGGTWNEITTKPYDSDDPNYRDPVWSNSGSGGKIVSGRLTSLAVDGSTLYAGAADGGVWKKVGGGAWQPLTDDGPTLSIGSLLVDDHHGLWVGTGEANVSSDSYAGTGVLYSNDGGANFTHVGATEDLFNHTIGRLALGNGLVFAATSQGLYSHDATPSTDAWTALIKAGVGPLESIKTCAQPTGATGAFVSDVAVRPRTGGQVVDAVVGWRDGSPCNGFFESTDGGKSFHRVAINGALNDGDMGRTTIAWSADGKKAYAIVQSAQLFAHPSASFGGTILQGVYASTGGFSGPWNKVAESSKLVQAGSAMKDQSMKGYHPGVQAWYNQFLAVDPADANHVFLGLEEVYETKNGGSSWNAVGPYWNLTLPCADGDIDKCPATTHPDQHAAVIAGNTVYVGNDGGVYSRGLNSSSPFENLNDGLRTLQYYYADAGPVTGGLAYWGGLQDNGESLLLPGAATMVSPFGGDGGDTYVDKTDGKKSINEYVGLDMALTVNGGVSKEGDPPAYREISPACAAFTYTPSPCDPLPRFIAPFEADPANPTHWIAGGEFVWDNQNKGWDTKCGASACDWKQVGDSGAGHSITQIAIQNGVWYAAWCGPCNGSTFKRGILTNAGGTVHQLTLPTDPKDPKFFPNRFIQGLTIDPANTSHVYVVLNGLSRRWTNSIPAGDGHVFETTNAGVDWKDISGNLPDLPADDLVIDGTKLIVATDVGVVISTDHGAHWQRLGTLPNVSVNDLQVIDGGSKILAATHGRGLWQIATP